LNPIDAFNELKSFCPAEESINKMKRQPTDWEKIFVGHNMQGSHTNQEQRNWWCAPIFLAFGRLRQEDHKLEAHLCHIARPWLKKFFKKRQINE
jgi:glycosidase